MFHRARNSITHLIKNHLQLPYLFQLYRALSKVQIEMRVDWLLVVVVEVGIFAWIMQIGSLGTKRNELASTQCRKMNNNGARHVTCHVTWSISLIFASDWFKDCFDLLDQSEKSIDNINIIYWFFWDIFWMRMIFLFLHSSIQFFFTKNLKLKRTIELPWHGFEQQTQKIFVENMYNVYVKYIVIFWLNWWKK